MSQRGAQSGKLAISPPGKGVWQIIDHIARPGSRLFSEYYYRPMQDGWNEEARRIGVIIRVRIREAGGFMYYQTNITGPRAIASAERQMDGYWKDKRFVRELETWDRVVKPASIKELSHLQDARISGFSSQELADHLRKCFRATRRGVKNHHGYTYTSFIPLGDFISQVHGWSQIHPSEILCSIEDGIAANMPVAPDELLNLLGKDVGALRLLAIADDQPDQAAQVFSELSDQGTAIGEGMRAVMRLWGNRIVDGYDVTAETYAERPDLLLKSLKSAVDGRLKREIPRENELLQHIPADQAPVFDGLLKNVLQMKRLRSERGFYTDLWAIGILRSVVLEIGRRLAERDLLAEPALALDASLLELTRFLANGKPVTSDELRERASYRLDHTVDDAPSTLGIAAGAPPGMANLSADMGRTMSGLMLAIELAVSHQLPAAAPGSEEGPAVLRGIPASRGAAEGCARVIRSMDQLREIQRGDILVVYQSTAAFNAVFPLLGGIVSQYGGTLSHPAILAREQGIPCVVGCAGAMREIETGMRICIDGTNGVVKIIAGEWDVRRRLESLQCDYVGPMQGRNRDRLLNHMPAVRERLDLVTCFRQEAAVLDTLEQHFREEIPTGEALARINALFRGRAPWQGELDERLAGWVQRFHIEFHPCDACNLRCDGCTYAQDHDLTPKLSSFPFDRLSTILVTMRPRAITLVGGGEPGLYDSQGMRLGDLISALGEGASGIRPAIGLITNGTVWPRGDPRWAQDTQWIRFSLDAVDARMYEDFRGRDSFGQVVDNVLRALTETAIPQVGVGYLYHPGNISRAGEFIAFFAKHIRETCPEQLHRFNIQFRPWRLPVGRPSIRDRILSKNDVAAATAGVLALIQSDPSLEQFIRQNTNLAVNLLCAGAREEVEPFSECYFGLAKTVIRADGSIYPCFRVAAQRDPRYLAGNILHDSPEKIALRSLFVLGRVTQQNCTSDFEKCLFCVFNNLIEGNLGRDKPLEPEIAGDYFF